MKSFIKRNNDNVKINREGEHNEKLKQEWTWRYYSTLQLKTIKRLVNQICKTINTTHQGQLSNNKLSFVLI